MSLQTRKAPEHAGNRSSWHWWTPNKAASVDRHCTDEQARTARSIFQTFEQMLAIHVCRWIEVNILISVDRSPHLHCSTLFHPIRMWTSSWKLHWLKPAGTCALWRIVHEQRTWSLRMFHCRTRLQYQICQELFVVQQLESSASSLFLIGWIVPSSLYV